MKLRAYLHQSKNTAETFRERLKAEGVDVSIGAVRKWITGERTPNVEKMFAIERVTAGMVKPADWIETKAAA